MWISIVLIITEAVYPRFVLRRFPELIQKETGNFEMQPMTIRYISTESPRGHVPSFSRQLTIRLTSDFADSWQNLRLNSRKIFEFVHPKPKVPKQATSTGISSIKC